MPRTEDVYKASRGECLFCEVASGKHPVHSVWEDQNHLAFLSRFPNTQGVTVVITKEHFSSYVFKLPAERLASLVLAVSEVGRLLDAALPDVSRTGLAFEGFGIDHVHAKLFPFHGTGNIERWEPIESEIETLFPRYEGYFCTNDGPRADDEELSRLASQIRATNPED